ncbi:MAG: (Fe-S)-binding protein [Cytophagales bacterium]|nr:MAG: (Fe-S)-binding protein [Cytophagales bacterium]
MKVALFVPCYIDQFYPQVAIATMELLTKLGCNVDFPLNQTCCGQPMANSGCEKDAISTGMNLVANFTGYDYIVGPSGSCVLHVREHYSKLPQTKEVTKVRNNIYELSEFLTDILQIQSLEANFPFKVGLHQSCHGQRGMRLSQCSELNQPYYSKIVPLLKLVKGIELIELDRKDECCGFGGTFCVSEEAVSARMGIDRINDHIKNGAQYITAGDSSCLMHLEGLLKRKGSSVRIIHLAELLNSSIN